MTKPAHCGRQINITAQALRAVRYTALEQNGITFDLWVAMEVLAETPGIDREKLIGRPAELRAHDHANAAKAIHELHDQGCSTTDDQNTIEFSTRGNVLAYNVLATRHELRNQLYGGIPNPDIATTNRVLDTVMERAMTMSAGLVST